jgi:hypothetical protein
MRHLLLGVLVLFALPMPAAGTHAPLPGLSLQDQDGRTLSLDALRGKVVVIVYGGRRAVDTHVVWGKRLGADCCQRGGYRRADQNEECPVRILAVAQMGKVPEIFRGVIRAGIRRQLEKGYSLWLDWEDRLAALYGVREDTSTVIVADRQGQVWLVVSGPPEGEAYRTVCETLRRLG